MNLRPPRPRQSRESIVPMINVVFLLLIFFLMTAQIAPPDPFEVTLPLAQEAADPTSESRLYISREGQTGYNGLTGAPAMELLIEIRDKRDPLQLRADAELEASRLAQLLRELAQAGFQRVEVMVGG
ncbi:ExbD/TolR family protein [Tropicimonas marinistellae]|uniref:ExbD/TolR family protein n=1 Tax=Tropicimonas marinistellae TaxID=1739787 RepID=UPI00083696FE|nr:biopolymer transporter ExbD [Tropicimonas marinistellae]